MELCVINTTGNSMGGPMTLKAVRRGCAAVAMAGKHANFVYSRSRPCDGRAGAMPPPAKRAWTAPQPAGSAKELDTDEIFDFISVLNLEQVKSAAPLLLSSYCSLMA